MVWYYAVSSFYIFRYDGVVWYNLRLESTVHTLRCGDNTHTIRCIVQPQGPPKLLILPLSSYPFISESLIIVENKQTVFLVIYVSYDLVHIVWPWGCRLFFSWCWTYVVIYVQATICNPILLNMLCLKR